MELGLPYQITKKEQTVLMVLKPSLHSITLMRKTKMNEADFKKYADRELVKYQRYKQIWQRATNTTIFCHKFSRCVAGFFNNITAQTCFILIIEHCRTVA